MTCEVSLGILPSTASRFKALIDDMHENGVLSKIHNRSITAPKECQLWKDFWPALERNSELDISYWEELRKLRKRYNGVAEARKQLPAYDKKDEILEAVENNPVTVITGETGCGKTTQIPQFILDDYMEKGKGSVCRIICCQPRKLSAAGVAQRISQERMEGCGGKYSTGYRIRFDNQSPRECGSILFCTTGILQNMMVSDPTLSFCSHIIIDEIHERRKEVDFQITTLRELLRRNRSSNCRVVLMSATIKAESFSEYFDNCPIIRIPGFMHPVEKYMLEDVFEFTKFQPTVTSRKLLKKSKAITEDFVEEIADRYSPETIDRLRKWDEILDYDLVLSLLKYICREKSKGAILIFFPGWNEIHELRDLICADDMFNNGSYKIVVLHSRIPIMRQKEAFNPPPRDTRKIVISTNIAEASITIDDVVYVIDCGLVKVNNFNEKTGIESLDTSWISKSSAQQRRGRAGRTQPGKCYHLFTSYRESLLDEFAVPEMLHSSLEGISLRSKLLDLCDIKTFYSKTMDEPRPKAVERSIEFLQTLDCLDENERLTPLGSVVAQLPLEPQLGKMILFGAIFSCLSPILTIASTLDQDDPFCIPKEGRTLAKLAKEKLVNNSLSDHIAFVQAYEGWEKSKMQERYCNDNFLSNTRMVMISKLRSSLCRYLYRFGFVRDKRPNFGGSNKNSEREELMKAILCAGLYPNFAVVDRASRDIRYYTRGRRVFAHYWSILNICPEFDGRWLVYYKRRRVTRLNLHDISVVRPMSLLLFGANLEEITMDDEVITLNGWMEIRANFETLQVLKDIRKTFLIILDKVITDWKTIDWGWSNTETVFVRAIIDHICKKKTNGSGAVSIEIERTVRSYQSWTECQKIGIVLTWKDLTVRVGTKSRWITRKKNQENIKRTILSNVTGSVHPGTLLAVMGGSGAGKSTFLNCLADRNCLGLLVDGTIKVNGYPQGRYMKNLSAYVQQDDLFLYGLTVREHLVFQARLRMDRRTTSAERLNRVEEILKELGLKQCENTMIGEPGVEKSLSGGERKRLAFASEILTDPPLLFCDEPTTGLDSFMAQNIVTILYDMASKGKTVVCTIHQPSSDVFRMFDRLLLLAEGRTAYLGPADAALDFFSSIGYICPFTFNPADYYIQILAVQPGHEERDKAIVNKICDHYESSCYAGDVQIAVDFYSNEVNDGMKEAYCNIKSKKVSWFVQFYMLLWRALLESFRNPSVMTIRTIQKIFLAIMIGIVYFQITLDQAGIMAVNGAIFVFITENTFPSMYGVLQTFPKELPIFLRENQNGLYRVDAYYLSKIFSLIPGFILEPILFMIISYWMIGLNHNVYRFLLTTAIIVLTANTASACGCFFSAAFESSSLAMTILVPIDVVFMITGGIFVNLKSLPIYISWVQFLSWFRYSNEATMVVQWEDVHNITCSTSKQIPCIDNGMDILKEFGFDSNQTERNIICLGILYIGFHILGIFSLALRTRKR